MRFYVNCAGVPNGGGDGQNFLTNAMKNAIICAVLGGGAHTCAGRIWGHMMNRRICRYCGLHEEQHHDFEPSMPEGCVCYPGEWEDEVPDPCSEYQGDGKQRCLVCEHDFACHRSKEVQRKPC